MMGARRAAAAALFVALAASSQPARAADCALALALALDISSSVNADEYEIQKGGLVRAMRDPEVRAALLAAPGSVRILVYEWSGWQQQDLIADWTLIAGPEDIDRLAARVEARRRSYVDFSTAIGRALSWGEAQFARLPVPCARQVIDVSGDGVNNDDLSPRTVRGMGGLGRVTVNGLVIKGADPDPEEYYRTEVIGGPGAFLMVARNGFRDYPDLLIGKLLKEIEPPQFIGLLSP